MVGYVFELEVLFLQAEDKLSLKDAKEQVLSRRARRGLSYVSLFKPSAVSSHSGARTATLITPSRPGDYRQVPMTLLAPILSPSTSPTTPGHPLQYKIPEGLLSEYL